MSTKLTRLIELLGERKAQAASVLSAYGAELHACPPLQAAILATELDPYPSRALYDLLAEFLSAAEKPLQDLPSPTPTPEQRVEFLRMHLTRKLAADARGMGSVSSQRLSNLRAVHRLSAMGQVLALFDEL